jgi:hypothetical protein
MMEVADERAPWHGASNWLTEDLLSAHLVLYGAGVVRHPVPFDDRTAVRRMLAMAVDCQLGDLMHALVIAGDERNADNVPRTATRIVEAVTAAASLAGVTTEGVAEVVFRVWRVAHLRTLLRPDSAATEEARVGLRRYAQAIEDVLGA